VCYLQREEKKKGEKKKKKSKRKPVGGVFSLSLSLLVKFKTRLFFHYYSNVFEELKKEKKILNKIKDQASKTFFL
jgi:hypothetical protein